MEFPEPWFDTCVYLLDEEVAKSSSVTKVMGLHKNLVECRFGEFWRAYEEGGKALTDEVVGFEDFARSKICDLVEITFRSLQVSQLAHYLGLSETAAKDMAKVRDWQVNGDNIEVPVNADNEAKSVMITENIKLEQLSKILAHAV